MITLMLLAVGVASAQDCQPTSSEQITSIMQQALLDFATLDEDSFFASTQQAEDSLPCLDEVFLPPNAAAYHRLMGLRAFFDGKDDDAVLSFRASMAIEPDYSLSSKLAPEGGKLHRLWTSAASGPNPFIGSFNAPAGKYAYVDGVETRTYAEDLPNIIQYGPGDGSILWTGYIDAETKPPSEIPSRQAAVAVVEDDMGDDLDALLDASSTSAFGASDTSLDDEPPVSAFANDEGSSSYSREAESTVRSRDDLVDAPKPEKVKSGGGKTGLIIATAVSGAATAAGAGGYFYYENQLRRNPTRQSQVARNISVYTAGGAGLATLAFGSLTIFTAEF
jgi:hypothetical protein